MESQERIVPAFSRGVGFWPRVARCAEFVEAGAVRGDACVMAIKHAIMSTVLGEGDGIGEEGPTRWIVVPRGVADRLGEFFSS